MLLVLGFGLGLKESLRTAFEVLGLGLGLELQVLVLVLVLATLVLGFGFGLVTGNLEEVLGLEA